MKTIFFSMTLGILAALVIHAADTSAPNPPSSVLPVPGLPSGPSDQPYPPDKNLPEKKELPRDHWQTNAAPGFGINTNSPMLTNNWPGTNNWPNNRWGTNTWNTNAWQTNIWRTNQMFRKTNPTPYQPPQ